MTFSHQLYFPWGKGTWSITYENVCKPPEYINLLNGIRVQQRVHYIYCISLEHQTYLRWMHKQSHRLRVSSPQTALSTSIQPAVLWLLDLHSDHLSPGEGQQGGAGGAGLVGHLRPKGSPSTAASLWLSGGAINAFLGRRSWRDDELNCLLPHMLADETS